jgi:hypothetical protein
LILAKRNNAPVFPCQGTWVYALAGAVQEPIKRLIAGKTKQHALDILKHLLGIQRATIEDIGDNTSVPSNPGSIHQVILEQLGSQAMRKCHVPM